MTDPSEQGGRPLASTTTTTSTIHFPEGNNNNHNSSSTLRRRRRRDSQSSDERFDGTKSSPSRRRLPPRKDNSLGPHAGSSRGESSTMQRSTSPTQMPSDMTSINYTRTGRISKAKKGLKVHNCECGRSYTRAEHLRRHQKNHASEAALVCDFPECGKTFYRPDLLQRHQERHNDLGKDQTSSYISQGTTAEDGAHIKAPASLPGVPFTTISQPQPSYYPTVASPIPEPTQDPSSAKHSHHAFGFRNLPVTIPIQVDAGSIPWHDPFSQSPQTVSSSAGSPYHSPMPSADYGNLYSSHPYGPGMNRTRTPSDTSRIEPWVFPNRSPTSTTSTMAYPWPSSDKSTAPGNLAYMHASSYPMTSVPMMTGGDSVPGFATYGPKSMIQRDDEEQLVLFPEESFGMDQLADSYPCRQYLDNYWRLFHPNFPVVHPTALDGMNQSPMLRAAMIAIGAQYSTDSIAKRKSRLLHDRCMKMFGKRDLELITEPERLCDFQALLLVEVMSQYRARRAAKTLSSRFENLYQTLHGNLDSLNARLNEITSGLAHAPENTRYALWRQWIDLAGQQRILQCCYILEFQQTIFLARTSHQSMIGSAGHDLPIPAHSSVWDAREPTEWAAMVLQQSPHTPRLVFQIDPNSTPVPFDIFQSSLLIAAHYNHFGNNASYLSPPTLSGIDHLLDNSPMTKHLLLTAKLVQVTPVRALLAVSGESWILSEKVPSAAAFAHCKTTLRLWVNGLWNSSGETSNTAARDALQLAIELLQQAILMPVDSLRLGFGVDMGLYYATLVIWAVTVVAHTRLNAPRGHNQVMRHSTPSPLPYDARNPNALPGTPTHLSAATSRTSQSPNPSYSTPSGLIQATQVPTAMVAPNNSMLYSDVADTALSFLNLVSFELGLLGQVPEWPSDVAQWQHGCVMLLRWVKTRFRIESIDVRASISGTGPTSGSDGLGELLDGVITVLEKMTSRGWDGWGF